LVGWHEPSNNWPDISEIDKFVSDRGEIAHKGSGASYIKFGRLTKYKELICMTAIAHDNAAVDYISEHFKKNFSDKIKLPWKRRKS
jgi:hypothetical protein